ncbi:MAG: peptide chain release factor N(5)-glutamine methyltransferase [Endomicrobium sp.]|jgi:release factor glutamine methyltransferase|nr:peptide chain release factor N(5)-glutamine methyltransferase [Endomicrobium sp.]
MFYKKNNIYTLLNIGKKILMFNNVPYAQLNAEILLSFVLNIDRSKIFFIMNKKLTDYQIFKFFKYIFRRSKREPIDYITGISYFMNFKFKVNKNVLIPRNETEILVVEVLKFCNIKKYISVLDLCTGSGCIAISLSKLYNFENIVASDINIKALKIAKINSRNNNVFNIKFINSNIYSNICCKRFDIIVSNPPYISYNESVFADDEIKYEPKDALVASDDGLFFYKKIVNESKKYLNNGGAIFVELNSNKVNEIEKMFKDNYYINVKIFNDYSGLPRILKAEI